MDKSVCIIDYGVGNLNSFVNIYRSNNINVRLCTLPEHLKGATHLILPGVGSFDYALSLFRNSLIFDKVTELVFVDKLPLLGICVGMQMMATYSEEGIQEGLNWIPGKVKKFNDNLIVPHMGWNTVHLSESVTSNLLIDNSEFYFLHSFYYKCRNSDNVLATSKYENSFDTCINFENIYGVQFHPEKSHDAGVNFLLNFLRN